jgi:predicted TIM-barrel fold metal-dependent hydrolase
MIALPPGACDGHCHIFGPPDRYPAVVPPGYALPIGSLDNYLAMAGRLGFERRVFVQPVTYGADSSVILDALRSLGSDTTRGIGGIPDRTPPDATLAEWHRLGLRGIRVNYTPYKPYEAGFGEAALPEMKRAAALLPHLDRMRVPFTLCHFGKFPARNGVGHADFQELLGYVREGEGGCHVKIAAAYQVSERADCSDVAPLAEALYEAAPDRILWGTDWPHIRHEDRGDAAVLLKLFGAWFPDEADRRRILVDNPARLFGFAG